jgi:hypothetical protein
MANEALSDPVTNKTVSQQGSFLRTEAVAKF